MQRTSTLLALLAALAACGDGQSLIADADGDGIPDDRDQDGDGDETPDPDTGGEGGTDSDGDGTPDRLDRDDDNDGTADSDEGDTDGDGLIDDRDSDDDNDGIPDDGEPDRDGDGVSDDQDPDDDNDGTLDTGEADGDGDGVEDDLDPDDDGDGTPDTAEADRDDDGLTNDSDPDDNNDGTLDVDEPDTDRDGTDDDLDVDDDNDGIPDASEADADSDGIIDDRDLDDDNDGTPDNEDDGVDGGLDGGALPPGTSNPSRDESITRYEPLNDNGGGYVTNVTYDASTETFSVDNLAFDGDNVYTRDDQMGTLSSEDGRARYAVYEADEFVDDDGTSVGQFTYRAIYGVSENTVTVDGEEVPASQFAIVRSGSYVDYGFGGFLYERNGGVELPTTGQAAYEGEYAGLRVFDGRTGLEYTRGDVDIAIDFRDFNEGSGVQGTISEREAFYRNGDPIPTSGEGGLMLPNLNFDVGPGTITGDGEMTNGLNSYVTADGAQTVYESGSYYAIVGGENAGEIVGVFVVESQDPRYSGVTAQETGGFIVYR